MCAYIFCNRSDGDEVIVMVALALSPGPIYMHLQMRMCIDAHLFKHTHTQNWVTSFNSVCTLLEKSFSFFC